MARVTTIASKIWARWPTTLVLVLLALLIEQFSKDSAVEFVSARTMSPFVSQVPLSVDVVGNYPQRMVHRHPVFPYPGTPAYFGQQDAMLGWQTPLQCTGYGPSGQACAHYQEYPIDIGYNPLMPNRQFSQVIRMKSQAFGMNTFHPMFHIIKNTHFPADAQKMCEHANRRLAKVTETAILPLYYQLVEMVGYDSVGAVIDTYCGLKFPDEDGKRIPVIFKASSDCHITIEKGDPNMKYHIVAE